MLPYLSPARRGGHGLRRDATATGSLTGEKGGIVGGSRFFAGKGAWIRRVEGLEGGDGCNREKGIVFPFNMEKGIVSKCE
jgi:hypothetical protein